MSNPTTKDTSYPPHTRNPSMYFSRAFALLAAAACTVFGVQASPAPSARSVTSFVGQRVAWRTDFNVTTLISNIEAEIRKDLYSSSNMAVTAKTRVEFETAVDKLLGPTDFMYFDGRVFDTWMHFYMSNPAIMRIYVIGNPIIAQTMAVHDPSAPMHVPLTLMVISGGATNETTRVEYDLPSSVIAITGARNKPLFDAAKILDEKLEIMARKVTGN